MEKTIKPTTGSITVLLLAAGSLWGLSEVAVNQAIISNGLPLRAAILTGIAFMIMGMIGGILKKARYIITMVVPALFIVQMGVVLCGNSVSCKTNTCVALVLHAGALSSIFAVTASGSRDISGVKLFLYGSAAALSSAVAFYFIGMKCAPCPYLLSFNSAAGFASYLKIEALPWMIFSGTGFSAGYYIGKEKFAKSGIFSSRIKLPQLATGFGITIACWAVSAGIITNF